MAISDLGLDFTPQAQANGEATPIQQAIRILSLRIPRQVGARGLAPQPLLASPGAGGMGAGGGMDLLSLLRQLLQPGGAGAAAGGGQAPLPMPGAGPVPRITPGSGGGTMPGPGGGLDLSPRPGPGVPTMPGPGVGPGADRPASPWGEEQPWLNRPMGGILPRL